MPNADGAALSAVGPHTRLTFAPKAVEARRSPGSPMRLFALVFLSACNAGFGGAGKDPVLGDSADGTDTDTGDTDSDVVPVDADGDGHDSIETGGDDCDDTDATVYPGAPELCDGKDNDCSGGTDGEGDTDGDTLRDCEDYCPIYALSGAVGDGRISDPVGSIQEAVDEAGATACNEARAFYGTYEENVDFHGYGVNLESVSGAASTIVDGGGTDSVFAIEEDGDGDLDEDGARIAGFTIQNGGGGVGAGIRIMECSPTIEDNVITDNHINADTTGAPIGTAGGVGGGIRSYNGSPSILGNDIIGNDACMDGPETGCDGGAIDIRGGAPTIVGNYIAENTAGDGGAIWVAYSDAWIAQNWILGNEADDSAEADGEGLERDGQGGGIDVQIGGSVGTVITNNIIADNRASALGGGLVIYEPNSTYGKVTVTNNVIAFNNVIETDWGAGFTQWNGTTPIVYNNIIYGNLGVGAFADDSASTFTFDYNDVSGNFPDYEDSDGSADLWSGKGAANLSVDPGFTLVSSDLDFTNDDFTLKTGSACIDAGKMGVLDVDGSASDLGVFGGPNGSWP